MEAERTMLGAFLDDSGTHAGSRVVAIGGLLGTDEQWDAFEREWTALLANPLPKVGKPPLRQFHLSHCRGRFGEFQDYTEAESNRLTNLFRSIILELGFVTVAAAVDVAAWNQLIVGDLIDQFGLPEQVCFGAAIDLLLRRIRFGHPGERISIFIDQGREAQLGAFAHVYRASPQKFPEIHCIAFAPVSEVIGLQGADMIATETYQYALECITHGRGKAGNPHFRDFLTREFTTGLLYEHEQISEVIARFRGDHSAQASPAG
jgi:hypothetical protein